MRSRASVRRSGFLCEEMDVPFETGAYEICEIIVGEFKGVS
jgi:hypothetical protein